MTIRMKLMLFIDKIHSGVNKTYINAAKELGLVTKQAYKWGYDRKLRRASNSDDTSSKVSQLICN